MEIINQLPTQETPPGMGKGWFSSANIQRKTATSLQMHPLSVFSRSLVDMHTETPNTQHYIGVHCFCSQWKFHCSHNANLASIYFHMYPIYLPFFWEVLATSMVFVEERIPSSNLCGWRNHYIFEIWEVLCTETSHESMSAAHSVIPDAWRMSFVIRGGRTNTTQFVLVLAGQERLNSSDTETPTATYCIPDCYLFFFETAVRLVSYEIS